MKFESFSLIALTCITFGHKGANVLFHIVQEEILSYPLISFGKT
jgi:hypothetical protein